MLRSHLLFIVISFAQLASGNGFSANQNADYQYSAHFFTLEPDGKDVISHISFLGSEIHSSESDVIYYFGGCEVNGTSLKLRSSIDWLDFEVDFDKEKVRSSRSGEQDLKFFYDAVFLGEEIKIIGIPQEPESFTVLYYSQERGVIGYGFFGLRAQLANKYLPPMFWVQGVKGICSKLVQS